MKQTAVNWLFQELWNRPKDRMVWHSILEKALQMEKEQQIALLKFSREMCTSDAPIDYIIKEFNKYYNETFNTKEK